MTEQTLLYGIGALKAGPAWLYRYLRAHPDAGVRSVQEVHYFDTFADNARARHLGQLRRIRDGYRTRRSEAERVSRMWQVDNLDRQIRDMNDMIAMLERDRTGDAAYAAFMAASAVPAGAPAGASVVADLTPAYGLQNEAGFARMAGVCADTRFVYLIRDPVDRLWAHVWMQARRGSGDNLQERAEAIFNRVVTGQGETQIPPRGDYRRTITRLRAALPEDQVLIETFEEMIAGPGLDRICAFAGLTRLPVPDDLPRITQAVPEMDEGTRLRAAEYLRDQYEFVAEMLGGLPSAWQSNYVRAMA